MVATNQSHTNIVLIYVCNEDANKCDFIILNYNIVLIKDIVVMERSGGAYLWRRLDDHSADVSNALTVNDYVNFSNGRLMLN